MLFRSRIISILFSKCFTVDALSIKKLTLLGFTLVALPLVFALLYSATQVNQLSKQGAGAIFDVAQLIKTNRELDELLTKMERYASQYVILKDKELMNNYLTLEQQLPDITKIYLAKNSDSQLHELSTILAKIISSTHQLILPAPAKELSLEQLQSQFKKLAIINQKINLHSNDLITRQANQLTASADKVSRMMLKSLIIIPVTIFIAGFFIFLITKPLKQLTRQIQTLEHGNFEQKIKQEGSAEIREIAEALEVMRTRLHALELQKSSFIRHISHELKTPLAAIREGTELLYDNSVGQLNPDQQEISNIIRTSVDRLQRLIEDLLNFNIILDSTSLQDSEKLVVKSLINKALNERILDIRRKKLIVKKQLTDIYIYSNAKQLNVILDNLLSNAIKYSPVHGTIKIHSMLDNNQMNLTISDQGPGITTACQDKIFDAFYQGPAPENSQIKGSGLGLTIVKELLMRLNGTVSIQAQTATSEGTIITVKLPRAHRAGYRK